MNATVEKRYYEMLKTDRSAAVSMLREYYRRHPEELDRDFERILADNADLLKRIKNNEAPVVQSAETSGLNPVK